MNAASDTAAGPQRLPTDCPGCGRPFSRVLKPKRRLQKKASVLILLGMVTSLAVAVLCYLFLTVLLINGVLVPIPIYAIGALFAVAAPAYLTCWTALRQSRVVDLNCRECRWEQRYLVDRAGVAESLN